VSIDRTTTWLILIYTVPRSPSRLRATIWRELKKVGAVYLRDGVCVLPERAETQAAVDAIAGKVRAFDGQAAVATSRLDDETVGFIVAEATAARAEEYTDLERDAEQFLAHVAYEREHRELTYREVEELEADRDKLGRWFNQVRARDYFPVRADQDRVTTQLARCDEALVGFLDDVYTEIEGTP
jgi:hypothetical protein